jgi:lysophospholipase L1-like esterase
VSQFETTSVERLDREARVRRRVGTSPEKTSLPDGVFRGYEYPPRIRLGWRRKLLFSLLTCCLVFGAIEMCGRMINGWDRHWIDPHRYHPVLGWCLREGWAGRYRWVGGYSQINAQGIRDDEPALPKPFGEKRLLVLGDSVTFGAFVSTQDSWPAQLNERLKPDGWRVLNGGVTGYDPSQEVDWLETYGWPLQPDVLAIAFCRNDTAPSDRGPCLAHRPMGAALRFVAEHSIVAHQLQHRMWRMQLRAGMASATRKPADDPDSEVLSGWPLVALSYRRLAKLAQVRHLPVVLVIFPARDQMDGSNPDDFSEQLHALAQELNWTVIDLQDAFAEDTASLFVGTDPIHPNAEGYRLAAERVEQVLRRAHVLEARPGYTPAPRDWCNASLQLPTLAPAW